MSLLILQDKGRGQGMAIQVSAEAISSRVGRAGGWEGSHARGGKVYSAVEGARRARQARMAALHQYVSSVHSLSRDRWTDLSSPPPHLSLTYLSPIFNPIQIQVHHRHLPSPLDTCQHQLPLPSSPIQVSLCRLGRGPRSTRRHLVQSRAHEDEVLEVLEAYCRSRDPPARAPCRDRGVRLGFRSSGER